MDCRSTSISWIKCADSLNSDWPSKTTCQHRKSGVISLVIFRPNILRFIAERKKLREILRFITDPDRHPIRHQDRYREHNQTIDYYSRKNGLKDYFQNNKVNSKTYRKVKKAAGRAFRQVIKGIINNTQKAISLADHIQDSHHYEQITENSFYNLINT